MRRLTVSLLVAALLLVAPGVASAQGERVPIAGQVAVGIDAGALIPTDDTLGVSAVTNVLYEFYLTSRVSFRTDFGWSNPAFSVGPSDSLRQMPLRFDVNYNWEGGRWHPFVGTGVGVYFLQFRSGDTTVGGTDTVFGLNTGGGIEYFLSRTVTIKGEGRYHAVADARGADPSGLVFTAGLKTYF
ncbi:MAG TPA: outer membrane beta-barrel protein [Vicinamibacterales bacterium]|nr:outer membrane beta-barrel protein [Vicinamibacterales bacterium]